MWESGEQEPGCGWGGSRTPGLGVEPCSRMDQEGCGAALRPPGLTCLGPDRGHSFQSPYKVTACLLVQLPLTCGDFSFPTHPQDHDPLFAALGPLGTASTKPRICIFLQQKGRRTSPSGAAWLAPGCCCWAFPSSHHSSGLLCLSRACTAGPGVAPAGQTVSSVPHQPPNFP